VSPVSSPAGSDAPGGIYDPDWVAAAARQADPGLPEDEAARLAREAWQHLREVGAQDVAELARRLLAGANATGATPANVVARAAVDFCEQHGVDPQA
jgi:hypothetical protein